MHLEIDRGDLRHLRWNDSEPADLQPGEVRLRLDAFALTANNITYAVAGDMLDYWGFFPAEAPWGRLPVMGAGVVVESTLDTVPVGGRYFGFFPIADHHTVQAAATSAGFNDAAPHRSGHAGAYRSFTRLSDDPAYDPATEGNYLLVKGLFVTSYLVDDFLADAGLSQGARVVVTSASSKTSIALAHCLRTRGVQSVGVTSAGNRSFVESLGLYDEVVGYDEITAIPTGPSVVVDMAGNAAVLSALHHHLGDDLRHSSQVGVTHHDAGGPTGEPLPGPPPSFFFAPSQMKKRSDEWGRDEFDARVAAALGEFVADSTRWLTVQRGNGPAAVEVAYRSTLEGEADPSIGHVLCVGDSTEEVGS